MTETTTSFQSSWTLAEAIIWEIAGHLRAGRAFWLTGSLEKYYWELEAVVRVMYGLLDELERDKARAKEIEILNCLPIVTHKEKKKDLIALLKDYDGLIMTFIHTHKLDIPPKRDRTVMIA